MSGREAVRPRVRCVTNSAVPTAGWRRVRTVPAIRPKHLLRGVPATRVYEVIQLRAGVRGDRLQPFRRRCALPQRCLNRSELGVVAPVRIDNRLPGPHRRRALLRHDNGLAPVPRGQRGIDRRRNHDQESRDKRDSHKPAIHAPRLPAGPAD